MKMRLWLLLLLLLLASRPMPARAQSDTPLVLAFYYAWFDMMTWEKPLPDKPVQPYHSSDVYAIQRHVAQSQQAGIDALVQAWYGPTLENNQTESNLRILLDQAQVYGTQAAVSVDMGGPFLQTEADVTAALQTLWQRHAQHPAYLRTQGRPVVFFWKQELFPVAVWQNIRAQVDPHRSMVWIAEGARPEYLEVFDGLYLYSVAWSDNPAAVLVRWGDVVRQWSAEHNAFRYWVATVMPGYNDLATGRANAFVRDRADGAYYRACWGGAQQSAADWVVLTSFNEWLEGTHIEPSVNYGETYLHLTAELAANFRAADIAAEPTATPDVPTAMPDVPTATPEAATPTATVILTPTVTPTIYVTPTATLTPTATPFRLSTPTPLAASVTPPPTRQAPIAAALTATPDRPRPLAPVEGSPPKGCALLPALLPVVGFVMSRWRQRVAV